MAAGTEMAADGDDPSAAATLEKFRLYETRARFYVIGSSREKRWFRVLKIDRSEPSELHVSEDPVWYSLQEVKSLLQRIDEGNRATGGLTFVTKAYGIAGPLIPCLRDRLPVHSFTFTNLCFA
ncbi:hypothetical protein PR202_gb29041 [Eleusine coracana subsp. coracana]|uniref:Uncharacterized protein n=1 Tax=Eleusine coracana subsp. coracana TaxID=191504 RepID=A0AAV5FYD8_ELECO|nr:hypothetical protein PR202_gb29041 [Eleusine coracana subsp. coracana]